MGCLSAWQACPDLILQATKAISRAQKCKALVGFLAA